MKKAVLITGGAKRLGHELALSLALDGWSIALHYHSSQDEALASQKDIRALGAKCEIFKADLMNVQETKNLIPQVVKCFPELCALINNASIFLRKSFQDVDEAEFDQEFGVHVKAPFFLLQSYQKAKLKGCIINILDTRVSQLGTEHFAYTLSKKSLRDLTTMAAYSLAPQVRVNGICPGPLLQPTTESKEYFATKQAATPLQSRGGPAHFISTVKYFLENEHVTGEFIHLDGGEHILRASL